jgi:hypothetical protein
VEILTGDLTAGERELRTALEVNAAMQERDPVSQITALLSRILSGQGPHQRGRTVCPPQQGSCARREHHRPGAVASRDGACSGLIRRAAGGGEAGPRGHQARPERHAEPSGSPSPRPR